MSTLGLLYDPDRLSADLALGAEGLSVDQGLQSAVIVSLFTDRRAEPDDPLPAGAGGDRRGWVGDALAEVEGDRFGSRLWLLSREKQTDETRRRAIDYCREALAWLIEDGEAETVEVEAEWIRRGVLGVKITIQPADREAARLAIEAPVLDGALPGTVWDGGTTVWDDKRTEWD